MFPRVNASDLGNMNTCRLQQARSNKIIVAGMSQRLEAILDRGKTLAGKSTTIIVSDSIEDLKVLLAIINSKLATWLTRNLFNSLKMAGGYLNYGSREVLALPVPKLSDTTKNEFIKLVDAIHDKIATSTASPDISVEINAIDELIYKAYGLTSTEAEIIS